MTKTTDAWAALDDRGVVPALGGLIDGTGMWRPGALGAIERTGRFLAGTWDPPGPEGEDGPGIAGEGSWVRFIGRIGAVALRAAAPSTRPERRERLLALLEMWAESPFADPGARLRTGIAVTERLAVRDERGAAVSVGWSGKGRRQFVDLRTGDAEPPGLGEIEEVAEVPRGWGSAEQLRRLVALVRERGPVPWDREAVSLLRERTGLGRPAASLALAGMLERMYVPFLDDQERATLRLKAAEAEDGSSELARLRAAGRLELVADVLPDDPAELWEPGGMRGVAERLAEAWRARYGARTVVPERTFNAVVELGLLRVSAAEFCAAFTGPAAEPGLSAPLDTWIKNSDYGPLVTDAQWDIVRFTERLHSVVPNLGWVYAALPAGDPVREGAPGLVRLLLERLDHPGLLLRAGHPAAGLGRTAADLHDRFGFRPYAGPERLDVASIDDGLTVVTDGAVDRRGYQGPPRLYFRPAFYGDDERSRTLSAVTAGFHREDLPIVEWLRGPACARIVERIESASLPAGAYESNPAASAPEVVARVAGTLGIDEDAAALYLQLLALPAPTDRNVRTWNGWKAPQHQKAAGVLVERGLVTEDTRPRAGRKVFLPGEWVHAKKPYQPMEAWKAELIGLRRSYNGRLENPLPLPTRTLPELFAHAWALVEKGEGPA
ncbi:hypothetical protein PS467_14325 [Streptomyces luomodiensis]|uniref:DNA-binding protein n=1 Tax=Streptomyces luomodiensis TaxID=3026192 RepID=A0ABY9UV34_9ACTN|nr:hypothetical protein [Streptomyces sp. SCA4-21]WNE96426.1 hypothetical protein PS467_14325 [Streptomyces sp. SCA4-21]